MLARAFLRRTSKETRFPKGKRKRLCAAGQKSYFCPFRCYNTSEASLLARACERHISTEMALCGTAKRRATQVADKISILSRFNVIYNDRFIINCFFNYPDLYTKISPRIFAGIKNYLLSSSVSSADYNQQMKKLHYRNGESRDICHSGGGKNFSCAFQLAFA